MEILFKIFQFFTLIQACLGLSVSLQGGQKGTVVLTEQIGRTVTMFCSAQVLSSGEPKLEWTYSESPNAPQNHLVYDGQVYKPELNKNIAIQRPYSLVVSELKSSDSGFYTCRMVSLDETPSTASATYNFTVLVGPDDDISCGFPSDLKLTLGQSASFRCQEVSPQAVPAPTFNWYKNGVLLPETRGNLPQYANASFSYSKQTGVLSFSKVVSGDAGSYYCEATNVVGKETCPTARITTKEVNVGAIVGIVFGVIFALILVGVLVWWTWRKGYCDGFIGGDKDQDYDAPDDGANDIMLDGAGPLVTKEPSESSNGTSRKESFSHDSTRSTGRQMPEGAVRVMP